MRPIIEWVGLIVAVLALTLVMVGWAHGCQALRLAISADQPATPAPDTVGAPTCSCDHAKAQAALGTRIDDLARDVGLGDVDVACLYRGHLLLTHEGRAARAVRDQPVPGAWKPLSPLVVPPVRADCAERFR